MGAIGDIFSRAFGSRVASERAGAIAQETMQPSDRQWLMDTFRRGYASDLTAPVQERALSQAFDGIDAKGLSALRQTVASLRSDAKGALVLKSVAAGEPMDQVTHYADAIRPVRESTAIAGSTVRGQQDLMQQFGNSCAPATVETAIGEADPVYAWKLKQLGEVAKADPAKNPVLAAEQQQWVSEEGATAVPRGATGGKSIPILYMLNRYLSPVTHASYQEIEDGSVSAAIDRMAPLLRDGYDVPVRVQFGNGTGHFMLAMAQRGDAGARDVLFHDPLTGKTEWIAERDLVKNRFPAIFGHTPTTLTHHYEAQP